MSDEELPAQLAYIQSSAQHIQTREAMHFTYRARVLESKVLPLLPTAYLLSSTLLDESSAGSSDLCVLSTILEVCLLCR